MNILLTRIPWMTTLKKLILIATFSLVWVKFLKNILLIISSVFTKRKLEIVSHTTRSRCTKDLEKCLINKQQNLRSKRTLKNLETEKNGVDKIAAPPTTTRVWKKCFSQIEIKLGFQLSLLNYQWWTIP